MKRTQVWCASPAWTPSGSRSRGIISRSAAAMLSTDTSPTTATATPPFSAKLTITWGRSRRSSRRRMLLTGTKAISPPFTAPKAGGRVRRAHAHSTLRSRPPPPPSRSVPGGRTPRHTSLTVSVGELMARAWSAALEVLIDLPRRDLAAVRLPLETLCGDESLREMVAERIDDHLIRLERIDGVLEVIREHADVATLELVLIKPVEEIPHGRRQREPPLDAVEPAPEHHCE